MDTHKFAKSALMLFLALRAGDVVNVAAGMWFVPQYVSPEEIGAVLPITSFATFLSLPVFAFAMTIMKEAAWLADAGERGKIKSLLSGVFAVAGIILVGVLAATTVFAPRFFDAMRISDASAGTLVVCAAFLGCIAPVYTDALQSLRRFGALAAVEFGGAVMRFIVMLALMPIFPLAGYFAGQASLPTFRIAGSLAALRKDLAATAAPFWNSTTTKRIASGFLAVLAYQAFPMAASLVELSVVRIALSAADSAGYYMASRFSDMLYYLTFPLMLVMFPYTASAAHRNKPTNPFVIKCSLVTLGAAALLAIAYAFFGEWLLALMPNGSAYAAYAHFMPWLVIITALGSCQVFYTNAEVSAGRHSFLKWFIPLHVAYAGMIWLAAKTGFIHSLACAIAFFAVLRILCFALCCIHPNGQPNRCL